MLSRLSCISFVAMLGRPWLPQLHVIMKTSHNCWFRVFVWLLSLPNKQEILGSVLWGDTRSWGGSGVKSFLLWIKGFYTVWPWWNETRFDFTEQSWPKDFIHFSASIFIQIAFFDVFFCLYDTMKRNCKCFISFKNFYWQINQIYSKSQPLQCWPFFFITPAVLCDMLDIGFWAKFWLMVIHFCLISTQSWS